MKVLHVAFGLPPYANGGLPLYVKDLMQTQKTLGHDPILLEPGPILSFKPKIYRVKRTQQKIYRITPALPVSYNFGVANPEKYHKSINSSIYLNFLRKISPDIIHIHSFMGIHKEFFESAKKLSIKIVMTTHDYYGLDLRANFVDANGEVYNDRNATKTAIRNSRGVPFFKQIIMQTNLYKSLKPLRIFSRFRKQQRRKLVQNASISHHSPSQKQIDAYAALLNYYSQIFSFVDYFIFNSTVAQEIYLKYLPHIHGEIIHPTTNLHNIKKSPTRIKTDIKLGYIGRNEKYKGVDILVNAANELGLECFLYGDDYSEYSSSNIHNMGNFDHQNISEIIKQFDILVMPSRCYETFAFSVSEALSFEVPVLASSHVGAKDLIKDSPVPAIFEPSIKSLSACLQNILQNHNLQIYQTWIQINCTGCSIEKHCQQIIDLYRKTIMV